MRDRFDPLGMASALAPLWEREDDDPFDEHNEHDEHGERHAHQTPPPADAIREEAMPRADWARLRRLPWGVPLEEWAERDDVQTLTVRKGESRHVVQFVERGRRRYALKETSPEAAMREITVLHELQRRGCRTLTPVGYVVTRGEPIPIGEVGGRMQYLSGDTGYCVTRLAERVLPQSILYRYPFSDANKRLLWNAVAELLLDLHEAGVYWGDPSLANVLMDLSAQRLTAVMADAETAEVMPYHLEEGMRQQDLDSFVESLAWQAEDIRLARELPEDTPLVTERDAAYFLSRYRGLRAERERERAEDAHANAFVRVLDLGRRADALNALGYGVLDLSARALRTSLAGLEHTVSPLAEAAETLGQPDDDPGASGVRMATLRPGWYVRRLRELLGVYVPRAYAMRIYQHLLAHKWLLSERVGFDVGMDAAARDWRIHIHTPLLHFIEALDPNPDSNTLYATYAEILDHTWRMSQREGRPVPLEEGALDYALAQTPLDLPDDDELEAEDWEDDTP